MSLIKIGENIKQKKGFEAFIPSPFPLKEGFNFDPKILKKIMKLPDYSVSLME